MSVFPQVWNPVMPVGICLLVLVIGQETGSGTGKGGKVQNCYTRDAPTFLYESR